MRSPARPTADPSRFPALMGALVVGVALTLGGCAQAGPVESTLAETPSNLAPIASSTSSPTTNGTSVPATTTTTTIPPVPVTIEVTTGSVEATVTVTHVLGEVTGTTPFAEAISAGPVTVAVEAEGYQRAVEELTVVGDTALQVLLDPPGQLVDRLTVIPTGRQPKQVAFLPDNSELWVTTLGGVGVEVYDPFSGRQLASIDLPTAGAVEVIFNQEGTTAYVSQMETASVYEIDVASKEVRRQLDTGGSWTKVMALSPDESLLYASNWISDDVSEIDLATGEVLRRIPTVDTPRGLVVTPDASRLYVAGFDSGEIQVIDLLTGYGEVIHSSGGSLRHLVLDPSGETIYASDMTKDLTLTVDIATNQVEVLAQSDRKPNTIDISPDGRVLFVSNRGANNPETYLKPGPEWGSVVLIDTATGDYLDAIVGGNQCTALDVSPDGTLLAYSDFLDDRVTVYRVPSHSVLAAGGGGRWEVHRAELRK